MLRDQDKAGEPYDGALGFWAQMPEFKSQPPLTTYVTVNKVFLAKPVSKENIIIVPVSKDC